MTKYPEEGGNTFADVDSGVLEEEDFLDVFFPPVVLPPLLLLPPPSAEDFLRWEEDDDVEVALEGVLEDLVALEEDDFLV